MRVGGQPPRLLHGEKESQTQILAVRNPATVAVVRRTHGGVEGQSGEAIPCDIYVIPMEQLFRHP